MMYNYEFFKIRLKEYKEGAKLLVKKYKLGLHILILIFTILFEVGDGNLWWDYVNGNISVLKGIEILTKNTNESLSEFNHPKEFSEMIKIIENNKKYIINEITTSDLASVSMKRMTTVSYHYYAQPTRIYILPTVTVNSGILKENYVLDYTPVMIEYYLPKESIDEAGLFHPITTETNELTPQPVLVGSIADIKNWVSESRRRLRFNVLTLFVGSLTFLAAL